MKGKNPKNVVFGFFRCAAAALLAARNVFPLLRTFPFLNPDWAGLGKSIKNA